MTEYFETCSKKDRERIAKLDRAMAALFAEVFSVVSSDEEFWLRVLETHHE